MPQLSLLMPDISEAIFKLQVALDLGVTQIQPTTFSMYSSDNKATAQNWGNMEPFHLAHTINIMLLTLTCDLHNQHFQLIVGKSG